MNRRSAWGKFLDEASQVLGPRQAAVCIELTKQFERCQRGTLPQLAKDFSEGKLKGEVVIVIDGNHDKRHKTEEENEDAIPEDAAIPGA